MTHTEFLTQEPWCWHPDQIARLTDRQVARYRAAAERRAEELKGNGKKPGPAPTAVETDPDLWDTDKTTREEFCRRVPAAFGPMAPRQDYGKLWDDLKAKRDAQDAGPDH